jgi:hypothetical protein
MMPRETVIRFVTQHRDPVYGRRTGILHQAYGLWHDDTLPIETRAKLRAALDWFNAFLEQPQKLAPSPPELKGKLPIAWIRTSARDHIAQLRRLADLIEEAKIPIEEVQTTQPGYTVYRDAYQLVALPFADTPL